MQGSSSSSRASQKYHFAEWRRPVSHERFLLALHYRHVEREREPPWSLASLHRNVVRFSGVMVYSQQSVSSDREMIVVVSLEAKEERSQDFPIWQLALVLSAFQRKRCLAATALLAHKQPNTRIFGSFVK